MVQLRGSEKGDFEFFFRKFVWERRVQPCIQGCSSRWQASGGEGSEVISGSNEGFCSRSCNHLLIEPQAHNSSSRVLYQRFRSHFCL
uniref:Uncharacterized protein n=1 Tax=Salix viminalis TaxID=40686 RepID=A0A6N2LIZ2_SALVM